MNKWIEAFPSTHARIILSLVMASTTALLYFAATIVAIKRGTAVGWVPDVQWLGFLCVWAGVDVAQFVGKRATFKVEAVGKE